MPSPRFMSLQGENIEELVDVLEKQRKEISWLLQNLDTDNVNELSANVVTTGVLDANLVTVKSNLLNGASVTIDGNGISISNGSYETFLANTNGDVILDGELLVTSNGTTPLLHAHKNSYGGLVNIYDVNGYINAKIGVESGLGDNVGGTIVLYHDSSTEKRVELGINKTYSSGALNLNDSTDVARVALAADSGSGPYIGVTNTSGTLISYLTQTAGYISSNKIATENWVSTYYLGDSETAYDSDRLGGTLASSFIKSGASTSTVSNHNHGIPSGEYIQTYDSAGNPVALRGWAPSGGHSHTV